MRPWGELLAEAATSATHTVVLAAPFVKAQVIDRLLSLTASQVRVAVFTRWRPDEVAAGVSDIEVFDVLRQRSLTSLYLFPALHAKYYRFDETTFIGSANLTGAALGWSRAPNLELLHLVPWPSQTFLDFETTLREESVLATEEIRTQVARAASAIPQSSAHDTQVGDAYPSAPFFPRTRNPEQLALMYAGCSDDLTSAANEQASLDLAALAPPTGLSSDGLRAFVGAALLQNIMVSRVDELAKVPRRFGEVRWLVARHLARIGSDRDPAEATQTLIRWLRHFLPARYTIDVPGYSELLVRRQ